MPKPPFPTALGSEIQRDVCPDCFADWKKMELMIINEYRLNMMDKEHRAHLNTQMRAFFRNELSSKVVNNT
jgi:Fe-S cluster biosynthesis and repair protein YggX